jgi:hypothetical protein
MGGMATVNRRTFLRQVGLTGAFLMVSSACTRLSSPRSTGSWADPRAWTQDRVPGPGDVARVTEPVILDQSVKVAGLVIEEGGSLTLASDKSLNLESSGNVLVRGVLSMRPDPSAAHTLRFVGVDESRFQGGGMEPVETDVGLWVTGKGKLDLSGTAKTPWSRELSDPTWARSDEIVIAPIQPGDFEGFVHTTPGEQEGKNLEAVGQGWKPEVLNLTRNVRIEGTPQGRSHVWIRSQVPQTIEYVAMSHLGLPGALGRRVPGTLGRYPLHFHHAEDGSRGSVVRGVVARHCGAHAFVPHVSHGITFDNCIAYDTMEDAYWWDRGDNTDDVLWEDCVAALVRTGEAEPFKLGGFFLGGGEGNAARNCVAVGIIGPRDTGGFVWPPTQRVGSWTFQGNLAHNNAANGFWAWQNGSTPHVVEDFVVFHNGRFGIKHGAYTNSFEYRNGLLYGNGEGSILLKAQGAAFETITSDGAGISRVGILTGKHVTDTKHPTVFRSCTFRGHTGPTMVIEESKHPGRYDLVDCGVDPADVLITGPTAPGTMVRVQNGQLAFAIDESGSVEELTPFADQG